VTGALEGATGLIDAFPEWGREGIEEFLETKAIGIGIPPAG
jgi:hypothetical protein